MGKVYTPTSSGLLPRETPQEINVAATENRLLDNIGESAFHVSVLASKHSADCSTWPEANPPQT